MTWRRTLLVAAASAALVVTVPAPLFAQDPPTADLVVTIDPVEHAATLGDSIELTVRVDNVGAADTVPLVVHIDITDLSGEGSVDPEDWTATLSIPIDAVPAGESRTAAWALQPISPGEFTVYAVVLAPELDAVHTSRVLRVSVDDQRSLNPGGILPVALGMPAIVGGLLLGQIGRGRRNRRAAR